MNKETGGPVFPTTLQGPCEVFGLKAGKHQSLQFHGATLRDYFAAQALQGLLAAWTHGVPEPEAIAQASYRYADDMLKARAE